MFNNDLCTCWLRPLQGRLTHLSIYTTKLLWGFWTYCDIRAVQFPYLKSLRLRDQTIVHEWQVEWMLVRPATLEQLLLDDCPIFTVMHLDEEQIAMHFPGLTLIYISEGRGIYTKELDL
ncbi:hypothetical protein P171DRAFT_481386 [Karstenula rhodostoma CBS 690.94]|uniref:F-box domain-containing protein n=1 Tax=Karstenula rhodostoma CBS 690.94 TaxID=1392251 RepID=A0A9P4UFA6_9PLEO|nr:hypothetical protein P171DRAFT_481386 [Karstenula rhodostoma CBS 690.94]